MIISIIVRKN